MSKYKKLTLVISVTFILIFLGTGFILHNNYCAPILMYHSVNTVAPPGSRLTVSVDAFRRQMDFLKKHRYNVISLEELAGLIRDKKKIPSKTVAITLDDGYKDNYTYAFPILKKYNLKATIFIIIQEIGRPDRLSTDEIKVMQDSGIIDFGSHCLGPEPLINIKSGEDLKKEIFDSKKALEGILGRRVNSFSYPGGRFNVRIRRLVIDAGYKLAVATNPGKKFPDDDVFTLKRLRISSTSDNLFIFWIESSGYYNFIRENRKK